MSDHDFLVIIQRDYLTDQAQNSHLSVILTLPLLRSRLNHRIDRSINTIDRMDVSPAIKQPTPSQQQLDDARARAATADGLLISLSLASSSNSTAGPKSVPIISALRTSSHPYLCSHV